MAGSLSRQILQCDWLPKQVRLHYLAHLGLPTMSHKKISPKAI